MGTAVGEVDEAVERLLGTMEAGETCSSSVRIHLGGLGEDWVILELTLTLLKPGFRRGPPLWEWSADRKLQFAGKLYSEAVRQVETKADFAAGFRKFRSALTLCRFVLEDSDDGKREETARVAGRCAANLTLCHLKLGNFNRVVAMATENLSRKPDDVKAFYRRGTARLELRDYEEAASDFEEACRLDPDWKAARQSLARARNLKRNDDRKMGRAMKKMFSS